MDRPLLRRAGAAQKKLKLLRIFSDEAPDLILLAHELRIAGEVGNMATKMKLLKMLQEVKGTAQITNRRPAPRPPLLYLMQLRSQDAQTSTPRRRLAIEAAAITAPLPIKINHIKPHKAAQSLAVA